MDHARSAPLSAKAQVEALFDSLALEYLRERDRQVSFVSQRAIVIDFLGEAKGRLLEVGCGPAVMTPELLAMGFEAHGIDVSCEMVRRAPYRMAHNRCVPWQFDRELERAGLVKVASRACNFMFFPLQELAPGIADSLNRMLLRFSAARFAPLIGAQYIVKAKKAA